MIESSLSVSVAFSEILEAKVPFNNLGAEKGDKIHTWSLLKIEGIVLDRIPQRGYLSVTVPSEKFETEMWYV
jgi:hypothetical protein